MIILRHEALGDQAGNVIICPNNHEAVHASGSMQAAQIE